MNLDTFLKTWKSQQPLSYRYEVRTWMEASYQTPLVFWEELFAHTHPFKTPTILFEKYDFYHDCVLRHLGEKRLALKEVLSKEETRTWTYEQLHALVQAQTALWRSLQLVKPKAVIVIYLPYGISFLVALMTALRFGATIAVFSPDDPFFGFQRFNAALSQIKPVSVITFEGAKISEAWNPYILDLTREDAVATDLDSHAYPASDPVQLRINLKGSTTIEAARSYLNPMRDGTVALGLNPADTWMRPFLSVFHEEPSATLAALLAGATIVHVSSTALQQDPTLVKDESIHLLGISTFAHDLWLKTPGAPKAASWYRTPLYGSDTSWRALAEMNNCIKSPSKQIVWDPEKGGLVLFSQPTPLDRFTLMHPSLGTPWQLIKLQSKEESSITGFGYFQVEPISDTPPHLILSQVGDEWMISASKIPLTRGEPYPIEFAERVVKTSPIVQACMIIPQRHPHHYLHQQFVLVIFVSPQHYSGMEQQKSTWKQQIEALIQENIGTAFVPDHMLFYALYPKMDKGVLNRHWVEHQLETGALPYKQKTAMYRELSALKEQVALAISQEGPK